MTNTPPASLTPTGTTHADLAAVRGNLPAFEGWTVREYRHDTGAAWIAVDDPRGLPFVIEGIEGGFIVIPPLIHAWTREVTLADDPLPDRLLTARGATGLIRRAQRPGRRRGT